MSRNQTTINPVLRWWRGLCSVTALAIALVVAGGNASAQSTVYSTSKRQFRVCNLLIDSSADVDLNGVISSQEEQLGPENPDPFVFYVADERVDIKPQNWEFINPLAPKFITAGIRARWANRDQRGGNQYVIGQPLRKNMAAYWEVSLSDASINDLLQYDLIFITNHRASTFTPVEREKLRKVVDGGGIVWVDNCGGMRMSWRNPFFLDRVQFEDNLGAGQPTLPIPDHPLLNSPYQLSFDEIVRMGDKRYRSAITSTVPGDNDQYASARIAPNQETLVTIIGNAQGSVTLPYIAVGNYGSGAVIIDAADTGCGINDNVGGLNAGSGGNSGAISGTNFSAADTEDLKFLYNMVAWGSSNSTFRRNNRRSGASFDGIGSALAPAWNFRNAITEELNATAIVDSKSAPLVVGGTLVVSGRTTNGTYTVRAYDLNPYSDLDRDGNYDDGLQDLSLGAPYDEVWRYDWGNAPVGSYPSAPTYASVLVAADGTRVDRIYVGVPNGDLMVITPARNPATGAYLAQPATFTVPARDGGNATGAYTGMPNGVAPSPAFFENRVYQVEPNGQVRCINAFNNTIRWVTFTAPPGSLTIEPTGSPTVGFARQTATGLATARLSAGATSDLMLYAPALVTDSAQSNSGPTARILTYWLGTRNEVTAFVASGNGTVNVPTRIGGSQGNGVGDKQYFMAPGPDTDGASPFITPRARIFSRVTVDGVDYSAQQEYQNGAASPTFQVSNIDLTTGIVTVTTPTANPDNLLSIDYDVEYIRPADNGNEQRPQNYTNASPIGARNNTLLQSSRVLRNLELQTAPTTAAFAPDDTLLYALTEAYRDNNNPGGVPPVNTWVTSVMGVNEQGGDTSNSRLRLRFSLFNNLATESDGAGSQRFLLRDVRGISVVDEAPVVNYLRYDANWPLAGANRAVRYLTPERIIGLTPVGPPVNTGDVTYFLFYGTSERNLRGDNSFGDAANANDGPGTQADVAVVMAFRTSPDIVLNLPEPFSLNDGVTLSQADVNSNPNQPSLVELSASQLTTAQMQLDPERGRVTLTSLRSQGEGMFNASQSFVVQYTPRAGGTRRTVVISPTPRNASQTYGQAIDESGQVTQTSGGFTPLLWYAVLPGRPLSPITLVGGNLYYSMTRGRDTTENGRTLVQNFVVALDAQPEATDPTVRIGFGEPLLNTVANLRDSEVSPNFETVENNHVRPALTIEFPRASNANASLLQTNAPPVGGRGILAVNSPAGTFAFNAGVTLLTENQRLLEVDAAASPLWSLEATINNRTVGGERPRYELAGGEVVLQNPGASGRANNEKKNLAKPRLAQRISASDYLIADTGNNRVIRTDRGGAILWSVSQVVDPYGILMSGEPTSLSGPTDAQGYTVPTIENGAQTGYEVHYLIADAGNNRIIEVADYYNQGGQAIAAPGAGAAAGPGDHVILWTTRTSAVEGRRLRYTSVQRFLGVGPIGTPYAGFTGYPYITAVVANQTVSQNSQNTQTDTAGGSLVVLNYQPYRTATVLRDNGGNVQVENLWDIAPNGGTARVSEPGGNGTILNAVEEVLITSGNGAPRPKRIVGPTYFRQVNLPTQGVNTGRERRLYLLCDAEAAYVVEARQDNTGKLFYQVLWYFDQKQYDAMNVSPARFGPNVPSVLLPKFQPMSIQLLGSGNFLIANGYSGRNALFESGQFVGEAFEVKPNGLTILANVPFTSTQFGGTYEGFSVPQISPSATPGLLRQVMGAGKGTGATGLVEQPTTAIRP